MASPHARSRRLTSCPIAIMAQCICRTKRTVGRAGVDRPGDVGTVMRVRYLVWSRGLRRRRRSRGRGDPTDPAAGCLGGRPRCPRAARAHAPAPTPAAAAAPDRTEASCLSSIRTAASGTQGCRGGHRHHVAGRREADLSVNAGEGSDARSSRRGASSTLTRVRARVGVDLVRIGVLRSVGAPVRHTGEANWLWPPGRRRNITEPPGDGVGEAAPVSSSHEGERDSIPADPRRRSRRCRHAPRSRRHADVGRATRRDSTATPSDVRRPPTRH